MRIGFDIDGTLTNFENFVFDYAISYMKKNFNMTVVNNNGYDLDEVFDIENQLLSRGYSAQRGL
jgi:FMN phosphatase YigB (HAD superfamily)